MSASLAISDGRAFGTAVAPDPVWRAIEHWEASRAGINAAMTDIKRKEAAIDAMVGARSISLADARTGQVRILVSDRDIDAMFPPGKFPRQNMALRRALDIQRKRWDAEAGRCGLDSDQIAEAAFDAEADAMDALLATVPTTLAGLVALIFAAQEMGRSLDNMRIAALLLSLAMAAERLFPEVRA
ncbi:hypothetical protein ACQR1V_02630 [Bradyrhizobium oligotrophicum]|uniref:hypothetical protein n=1 Tax=Bradyrhizobium oligotrophicum TaxID=44255 RepID=UPI003EC0B2EA